MTCYSVPKASKGKESHGRRQEASVNWQPSLVTLRSGDKVMRGRAQVQQI